MVLESFRKEKKDLRIKKSIQNRGGVLEDVLGLEDTFWSLWPWSRRSSPWPWLWSLKSSKIALSSARGQHYFLNCWKFIVHLKIFLKTLIFGDRLKNYFKDLFFWKRPEKTFLKTFFLENTCACVLGPWHRAFLSLASEGLSLALDSFCVLDLDLEPCVLDSTSDSKARTNRTRTERTRTPTQTAERSILSIIPFVANSESRVTSCVDMAETSENVTRIRAILTLTQH